VFKEARSLAPSATRHTGVALGDEPIQARQTALVFLMRYNNLLIKTNNRTIRSKQTIERGRYTPKHGCAKWVHFSEKVLSQIWNVGQAPVPTGHCDEHDVADFFMT